MSSALKQLAGVLGRSDAMKVDPFAVGVEEGWNPRTVIQREGIESLKTFIRAYGVMALPPIRVHKHEGTLVLRDGQRRVTAVRELIDEGVPIQGMLALLEPAYTRDYTEADSLMVAIGANGGEPLSPLDEASAFARLIAYGWDATGIAQKSGKSRAYVSERLKLLEADDDVVAALTAGEATLKDVVDTVRHTPNGTTQGEHLATVRAAKEARKRSPREPTRQDVWGYLALYGVEAVEAIIHDYQQGQRETA